KDAKVVVRQGRLTKEIKLTDLELRKFVQVRLDETKKIVQAIEVHVSTVAYGMVTHIDPAKHSITVASGGRGDDVKKQTFELAKEVKVVFPLGIAGTQRGSEVTKEGKLADVAPKAAVSLQLDDHLKIVQAIRVNLPTMQGTLRDVDAAKGRIILRPV